jgi:hypothetical protein
MQQRVPASRPEGSNETEHWMLYTVGRETKLKERKISKEDYVWLIKLADKLHQE